MTADLHAVPGAIDPTVDADGSPICTRWEPQHQFVGALLWHDAARAGALLELVPSSALADPLTRWIAEVIAGLLTEGRDPTPPAVLHRARTQPAREALHPNRAPTAREHHRFANHLAELYTRVVDPHAAADVARDVLDDAYRATFAAAGRRMQELTETATSTAELTHALDAVLAELDELRRRAATAAVAAGEPSRRRHCADGSNAG